MTTNGTPFSKQLLFAPRSVGELRRDVEEMIMQGFRQDKEPAGICVTTDSFRLLLQAAARQASIEGRKFEAIQLKGWLGLPLMIANYDGVWFRHQVKVDSNPVLFPQADKDLGKGEIKDFHDKRRWAKDQVVQRTKKAKGKKMLNKSRGSVSG